MRLIREIPKPTMARPTSGMRSEGDGRERSRRKRECVPVLVEPELEAALVRLAVEPTVFPRVTLDRGPQVVRARGSSSSEVCWES